MKPILEEHTLTVEVKQWMNKAYHENNNQINWNWD